MNLRNQLLRDEGLVRHAYQDSEGYWTIGVGRLIDKRKGGGLTDSECMYLLDNDISRTVDELQTALPWTESLDEARRGVLLNMAFNMGVPTLLQFRKTLALVRMGKYSDASREMLDSRWARQVGDRAKRLSVQMATGDWQ